MFSHKLDEKVNYKTYFDWFLLSFLGGNINAGGYLASHQFVSHVTGFSTLTGVAVEKGDWLEAMGTFAIPLFFLLGAMISAFLTEKRYAIEVHGERFAPVMGLSAILLGAVAIGGSWDYFAAFGGPLNIKHHFVLLACLCGACGLQNAAITSASGLTIRTTHMTGLTTDLGIGLIRAEVHHFSPEHRRRERKANLLRIGTLASFISGSLISAFFYTRWQYRAFYISMGIALYAAWIAHRSKAKLIAGISAERE